jgi:hypothetical protein
VKRSQINLFLKTDSLWNNSPALLRDAFVKRCRGCLYGREETHIRFFWFRAGWTDAQVLHLASAIESGMVQMKAEEVPQDIELVKDLRAADLEYLK